MMQKHEVLDEARNSVAMLKSRLMGDYENERLLMEIVTDPFNFVMAQNALMVSLTEIIDRYADYLMQYAGIKVNHSIEVIDALTQMLAAKQNLELDIDTREVD
jgi:hypothetical protein